MLVETDPKALNGKAKTADVMHDQANDNVAYDLSICIVSWNTRDVLRDCLKSIYEHTHGITFEIIVVDNDSLDDSCAMMEAEFPRVRLIRNKENAGFGRACNQGMAAAAGRYYLLLNSDTWLEEDSLSMMVRFMDAHPEAGAAGCWLRYPDGRPQAACGRMHSIYDTLFQGLSPFEMFDKLFRPEKHFAPPFLPYRRHLYENSVGWIVGACIFVRREAVDEVGMLDENIFMFGEENEWCYRIKQSGWDILYTPETYVVHIGGASWTMSSAKRVHAILSSMQYYYRKHYGEARARLHYRAAYANAWIKYVMWRSFAFFFPSVHRKKEEQTSWHVFALEWCKTYKSQQMLSAAELKPQPKHAVTQNTGDSA